MYELKADNEKLDVLVNGTLVLRHTEDKPFITAIKHEKKYKLNRGTAKTEIVESERIPLRNISVLNESKFTISAEGHSVLCVINAVAGGISIDVKSDEKLAYEFTLPADKDEAVFGGGEQYRKVNLRNEKVSNFVSEHIKASTIIEKAVLPMSMYREKEHKDIGSYSPMPVFITDRCRLIYFDTAADGSSDFCGTDHFRFSFDRCPDKIVLLKADSYGKLGVALSNIIPNRQYIPEWCHDGMILGIQGGTDVILDKTFTMLDAGANISAVWSQDWSGYLKTIMGYQVWWNWEADEKLYHDFDSMIKKLNSRGVKFLAYINPYLVKDSRLYKYCSEKGYLITKTDGSIYHIKSTTFDAGMLDLTNPEAVRFIKDELIKKNMLDRGISGWMADFGEYLPVDCVLHNGNPAELHNKWPVMWAKINREAIEENNSDAFFFTRSGYLGIQTYAPLMWNGDQHTDFSKDYGMPCVMPASFSLGFSGVTMVHCDIGGFFSFGKMKRGKEHFIRWMEMGAFSLLMRSHESIRPWANVQFDAEGVKDYTVKLTRLHSKLKPYLLRCIAEAKKGLPAIRPGFWEDNKCVDETDAYSYFLGEDLFVCPVIELGARERLVSLPDGEWTGFWSGNSYTGGKDYTVPAPVGQIPVFYRKNSNYASLFRKTADEYKEEKGEN